MIDTFNFKDYDIAIININEKTKHKWDLEEDEGFLPLTYENNTYKIRDTLYGNEYNVLRLLNYLNKYLFLIKIEMYNNEQSCIKNKCHHSSELFIKTKTTLQEIPKNNLYEGINKPKFIVYYSGDGLKFKRDNKYRSGLRHIMLSLRDSRGKIRSWAKIKKLFIHELTHTMCNHCTYREKENHEEDFHQNERFLKLLIKSPNIIELEKEIITNLFS